MPYISYNDRGTEKYYQIPEDRLIIFGREDHSDFQILKDSMISREHFGIEKDESGNFVLVELGASNGTFLNEKQLESNSIVNLKEGDIIRAGRQRFTFREAIQRKSASQIMDSVAQSVNKGKGYRTIMCEILGMDKDKLDSSDSHS